MNKYLTKINKKWFEKIQSKFTEDEKKILQENNEELKSEIFRKFQSRSIKLAEESDVIIAENVLINNKIDECSIASVVLPTKHGFAITSKGWIRF